jgi:aspartyl-tRNA(Asn)/glutamyl-tRNA(Gln) amidotransferase subunit C
MSLTRQEVEHVAALVRLKLTETELAQFQHQLSEILDHIQTLQELDTRGVEPTSGILAAESSLRNDEPSFGLELTEVLQNAQSKDQKQFKVPPVFGGRDG